MLNFIIITVGCLIFLAGSGILKIKNLPPLFHSGLFNTCSFLLILILTIITKRIRGIIPSNDKTNRAWRYFCLAFLLFSINFIWKDEKILNLFPYESKTLCIIISSILIGAAFGIGVIGFFILYGIYTTKEDLPKIKNPLFLIFLGVIMLTLNIPMYTFVLEIGLKFVGLAFFLTGIYWAKKFLGNKNKNINLA